jgi:outer membrane receptor protein involved in Fe transport
MKPVCRTLSCAAGVALAAVMFAQPAGADSAFIAQAGKGGLSGRSLVSSPVSFQSQFPYAPPRSGATQPTPETSVAASGGNYASTLEMGRNNVVFQSQSGGNNFSNVGILGGAQDNVDVLQHGQGLFSNLYLVGVKGLTVDVLEPPGTAPVDMLIARMPNGTLDIFQPKGAPAATVFHVGNVLVVK